ncbi:hypothetical protein HII31_06518 [Pseudocercospora fuligena]|uniref:Uncharacterized protein n=1 Tax=Pseudocercospora fuligena TaxID=685502 RepID=A0A8H6VIY6_9PEZI|nr:hypothetical protein HII31_06518 [Pseudocercospora fuligena]
MPGESSPLIQHNPDDTSQSSTVSPPSSSPKNSKESSEESPSPAVSKGEGASTRLKKTQTTKSIKTSPPASTTSNSSPIKLHTDELTFTNGLKSFNLFEKGKHPKHANNTHQRDSLAYAMDNNLITPEARHKYAEQHKWFFQQGDGKTSPMRKHEINVYDNAKAHDGIVQDETAKGDEASRRYRDARRCRHCWSGFCECTGN